jgi:hypothetical protein
MYIAFDYPNLASSGWSEMLARSHFAPSGAGVMVRTINYRHLAPSGAGVMVRTINYRHLAPSGAGVMVRTINYRHLAPSGAGVMVRTVNYRTFARLRRRTARPLILLNFNLHTFQLVKENCHTNRQ